MELNVSKMANIQRITLLTLFFAFLLLGFQAFAADECNPDGWNNSDCTVDIYYEDPSGGSDLDECYYTTESGASPTCPTDGSWDSACNCKGEASITCPVTISIGSSDDCNFNGGGGCKVCSKATDGAGNAGYGELSLNIDFATPTTTIECDGEDCKPEADWYNATDGDVIVTLDCYDCTSPGVDCSGCDKTYYCIDQAGSCNPDPAVDGIEYTDAFTITTEGTNYVMYYSKDIAGNIEPTNSKTIKLDKTGPKSEFTDVATPPAGSTVTNDFDVSVNDWDRPLEVDNSGLSSCYYSVYDSGVGYTKSGDTRNCNSDLSFTVTVSPTGDCQTIGGTCTVSVYAYDIAGNPGDGQSRTFNISSEAGLVCNINVPDTGIVNQWIVINVSGSQGEIVSVKFSSDNVFNGSPDGSWDGPYNWSSSSGNWDAGSKTMKWSFAATGNYEVWAEITDGTETASCYDVITIFECYPGQEDSCISGQGCSHIIICKPDGTWPACPEDECIRFTENDPDCPCSGIDGCFGDDYYDYPDYGDCNSSCSCDTGIGSGQPCAPTVYPSDPRCVGQDQCDSDADCNDGNPCTNNWCERPEDPDSICHRDNIDGGISCGICKECDGNGNCVNRSEGYDTDECGLGCQRCVYGFCQDYNPACAGTEASCECISDLCIDCSDYYDGSCGYQGICHCGSLEIPIWECLGGNCSCVCQYDPSCEWEPDGYPEVIISPPSQEGNPGDELFYEVTVINPSEEEATFTVTASVPPSWEYWLDSLETVEVTIGLGQSEKIPLRVKSSEEALSGEYDISVTAQNKEAPEYFGTGYTKYVISNQPPEKPGIPLEYQPSGVSWDNCSVKALSIPTFHWIYSDPEGDNQTAYEIWVDDDSNFPDPKFNYLVEHIPLPGPQFSYRLDFNHDQEGDWLSELAGSATYYWKVKVRDDHNNWSEWLDPTLFTTPAHAGPWPEFTPSPARVSLNQVVTFEDGSKCYTSPGNVEYNCQDLGVSYEWDFDYIEPTFTVDDTTKGNATTAYGELGNYKVKLRITDDIDTCYSETESVTVTLPLPEWREIPPF